MKLLNRSLLVLCRQFVYSLCYRNGCRASGGGHKINSGMPTKHTFSLKVSFFFLIPQICLCCLFSFFKDRNGSRNGKNLR